MERGHHSTRMTSAITAAADKQRQSHNAIRVTNMSKGDSDAVCKLASATAAAVNDSGAKRIKVLEQGGGSRIACAVTAVTKRLLTDQDMCRRLIADRPLLLMLRPHIGVYSQARSTRRTY